MGAVYGPLPAGYHRDLQLTKEPFLEGMQSLLDMLAAFGAVLGSLGVDVDRCRRAVLTALTGWTTPSAPPMTTLATASRPTYS